MVRRRDDDNGNVKTNHKTVAGERPAKARRKKGETRIAASDFSIEAPALPAAVKAAAMRSGGYPYDKKMKRKPYEKALYALQIELLKMQASIKAQGERLVVVIEGRDGAGKGGTINRFTQHLNSRGARIVALAKPSDAEQGQWYFQRYVTELPTAGEIVFFDRSWYNRAGVEPVMGFCSQHETEHFLEEVPTFERMLVRDGIRLVKIFLTIGREMQMKRLHARHHDPLKRWKLSPLDFAALDRWDDYSRAFETMLATTSTEEAPWTVVRGNDKLRARLGAIRHVLRLIPYEDKDMAAIEAEDGKIVLSAEDYLANGGEPETA